MKKTFVLTIFDSRNTAINDFVVATKKEAVEIAKNKSVGYSFPVIVSDKEGIPNWFEKYENGRKTEWSF